MKSRLFWIVAGGLSFWLPGIVVVTAIHEDVSLWTLNIIPLAGVAVLGLASWIISKSHAKWGWVLAGIYILGPVSMLAPVVFLHVASSPKVPGENIWTLLFCLFPPMTLWMAALNGMIFSVLIATLILPFLAAYLNSQGLQPSSSTSH